MGINEITMIIKTFERPACVSKLVASIYKYYPNAIVRIGDDSEVSCKYDLEKKYANKDLKVYDLPKDCGLSYGRNFLLKKTKTKYFLLLDDDFVFDKKTKILECLQMLIDQDVDILGGYFRNYKIVNKGFDRLIVLAQSLLHYELPTNYIGTLNFDEDARVLSTAYETLRFPEFEMTDIVHNFFLAKTDKVRDENLWDEDLKLQEHTPFFLEAKRKGFKVATTNQLSTRHMPERLKKYSGFRGRDFVQVFMNKYDVEKIINTHDGKNEKIILRKKIHD